MDHLFESSNSDHLLETSLKLVNHLNLGEGGSGVRTITFYIIFSMGSEMGKFNIIKFKNPQSEKAFKNVQ